MEKWNAKGKSINPILMLKNKKKIANNFTTASTDFNSFSIDYFLYYYTSITI